MTEKLKYRFELIFELDRIPSREGLNEFAEKCQKSMSGIQDKIGAGKISGVKVSRPNPVICNTCNK